MEHHHMYQLCVMKVPEGEGGEKEVERLFEEIMAQTSQTLIYTYKKFNKLQVGVNSKRSTPRHNIINLPKAKPESSTQQEKSD